MKLLTTYALYLFQNNSHIEIQDRNKLISILSISLITVFSLLCLALFKAHKQKNKIEYLEKQLSKS